MNVDPTTTGFAAPSTGVLPAVPGAAPPERVGGASPGSRLTPEEMLILDQAFTPEVLRILLKAFPELEPILAPFLQNDVAGVGGAAPPVPANVVPATTAQSPLGNIGRKF